MKMGNLMHQNHASSITLRDTQLEISQPSFSSPQSPYRPRETTENKEDREKNKYHTRKNYSSHFIMLLELTIA